MRRSKYGAIRVEVDGIRFDSKAEAIRYRELKLLDQAGKISRLTLQPTFLIQEAYTKPNGKRVRKIEYRADFQYFDTETGEKIVEDVKGMATAVYKLKKKLVEKIHDIEITEIKR